MDKIIVIDKGIIVEQGTQTQLIAMDGFYNKLRVRQAAYEKTWLTGNHAKKPFPLHLEKIPANQKDLIQVSPWLLIDIDFCS